MAQATAITGEPAVLGAIKLYIQENPESTNTQLFSFLALLSAYLPDSYLLMSECQKILGPPDPIHGGPPFEERMEPFTALISISGADAECRCSLDPGTARKTLKLLAELSSAANLRFTRSEIVQNLIRSNFEYYRPDVVQYIKDLLTKREKTVKYSIDPLTNLLIVEKSKEDFSRLITHIQNAENPGNTRNARFSRNAVSVLETASDKFNTNPIFPQTISRLYYKNNSPDYDQAKQWALEAIRRAPHNSYVADTLGQIYKKRLAKANRQTDVIRMANEAFKAFEDVEEKAEREDGPDTEDAVSSSESFNNRGRFGFIQVAKLAFEKYPSPQKQSLIQNKKTKVEVNFDFFEWYLTYSTDMETPEPGYFWWDVAQCYKHYTTKSAADSTSFAGLLDLLNHGHKMSKGRRAGFKEDNKTVSDLENIRGDLKHSYEDKPHSVDVAQRYILSNIILNNINPDSPHITQMTELKEIISRFLDTDVECRRPEFYLLVLLLFWSEVEQNQNVTLDLAMYATYMESAFERVEYAKYLRGRYLLPLFFLGKGSGLSKWIHKFKLDAIVENQDEENQRKMWEIPEIHDMLLPVMVDSPTTPQEQQNQEVFVCVGENKIKATAEGEAEVQIDSSTRFYLAFTIRGPIVFKVRPPHLTKNKTEFCWDRDKP